MDQVLGMLDLEADPQVLGNCLAVMMEVRLRLTPQCWAIAWLHQT